MSELDCWMLISAKSQFLMLALVFQKDLHARCHFPRSDHPLWQVCLHVFSKAANEKRLGVLRDLWVFSFLRAAYGAEAMQSAQSERELHLLWVKQVDVYVCGRREQREWYKVKRGRKMMCCWCFTVYVLCLQVCRWCLCRPLNVSVKADHRWSVLSIQPCSWITAVSGLIHTHPTFSSSNKS